jgi:uncharacterized protein YceK
MRIIALLLMVFALVTGCAGARSESPKSVSYATATDRNLAGYGLHMAIGGYVQDSGVWDLKQGPAPETKR